ncbi:hypothetical protein HU200_001694 [Digitaria exilis]|uniref:holocytochrome-c synthase n=1 Tax=Digitaria exilis TaxID=1010633 RepID=A0A835FZY7_9POAL|nr:hypothetical protein HU200_001694 [Digitaria exilis]
MALAIRASAAHRSLPLPMHLLETLPLAPQEATHFHVRPSGKATAEVFLLPPLPHAPFSPRISPSLRSSYDSLLQRRHLDSALPPMQTDSPSSRSGSGFFSLHGSSSRHLPRSSLFWLGRAAGTIGGVAGHAAGSLCVLSSPLSLPWRLPLCCCVHEQGLAVCGTACGTVEQEKPRAPWSRSASSPSPPDTTVEGSGGFICACCSAESAASALIAGSDFSAVGALKNDSGNPCRQPDDIYPPCMPFDRHDWPCSDRHIPAETTRPARALRPDRRTIHISLLLLLLLLAATTSPPSFRPGLDDRDRSIDDTHTAPWRPPPATEFSSSSHHLHRHHHHHHHQSLFLPSSSSSPASLYLDSSFHGLLPTSSLRALVLPFPATTAAAAPPALRAAKPAKKRPRASRPPATTVLTTDTSNFRAMVQDSPASPGAAPSPPRAPRRPPRLLGLGGASPPSTPGVLPASHPTPPTLANINNTSGSSNNNNNFTGQQTTLFVDALALFAKSNAMPAGAAAATAAATSGGSGAATDHHYHGIGMGGFNPFDDFDAPAAAAEGDSGSSGGWWTWFLSPPSPAETSTAGTST